MRCELPQSRTYCAAASPPSCPSPWRTAYSRTWGIADGSCTLGKSKSWLSGEYMINRRENGGQCERTGKKRKGNLKTICSREENICKKGACKYWWYDKGKNFNFRGGYDFWTKVYLWLLHGALATNKRKTCRIPTWQVEYRSLQNLATCCSRRGSAGGRPWTFLVHPCSPAPRPRHIWTQQRAYIWISNIRVVTVIRICNISSRLLSMSRSHLLTLLLS